ncbi:MAG: hypothetical protein ABI167_06120 [Nitrosospira sp.]
MSPTDDHILFITLDSCRFDTFAESRVPNLKAIAPFYKAQSPGYFTYGSHSAMFVGFTPGIAGCAQTFFDPKFGKLFKLVGIGYPGKGTEGYALSGRNIIEGFNDLGYKTIGTAAMGWFDPATITGAHLIDSFSRFFYAGPYFLDAQIRFVNECLAEASGPTFTFMNIGETHAPYWHEGADWSADDNPCIPYQSVDRSAECRIRQRSSLEFIDRRIGDLLRRHMDGTIIVCADHGDCWGEDGLWEHAFMQEMTTTVPLVMRYKGEPCVLQHQRDETEQQKKFPFPSEVSGQHETSLTAGAPQARRDSVPKDGAPGDAVQKEGKKRIVVVLGMHRSGTSAVARSLRAMGVDLGDRMPPPQAPNPKGFWEDQDLCGINCEIMHVLGSDWHHLAPLALHDMETQQENYFLSKAAKLLSPKFSEGTIFGFKDPRTIKLLPFWKKVFLQCQLDIGCVLAIRHPLSVSQSLTKRDGFDAEKNYFLWLGHVIESLSGSAGLKRVLVDYDRLMLSPELEVKRIAEKLDLKIDEVELKIYSAGFLDRSLRHTTYGLDDLSKDEACPSLVREVYAALLEVASGENHLDDPALQDQVARWVKEYERLKPILLLTDKISEWNNIAALQVSKLEQAAIARDEQITHLNQAVSAHDEQITYLNQAMIERDAHITHLDQAAIAREGHIAHLNQAVIERDAHITHLDQVAIAREEHVAHLNQAVIERDAHIAHLNQTVEARDEQSAGLKSRIEDIYASTSWRLTRPMRATKLLISPRVPKSAPNHPDQRNT